MATKTKAKVTKPVPVSAKVVKPKPAIIPTFTSILENATVMNTVGRAALTHVDTMRLQAEGNIRTLIDTYLARPPSNRPNAGEASSVFFMYLKLRKTRLKAKKGEKLDPRMQDAEKRLQEWEPVDERIMVELAQVKGIDMISVQRDWIHAAITAGVSGGFITSAEANKATSIMEKAMKADAAPKKVVSKKKGKK